MMFWFYLFWEHICQAGPRYCPGPTRGQMMGRLAGGLGGRPGGQGTFAKLKSKENIVKKCANVLCEVFELDLKKKLKSFENKNPNINQGDVLLKLQKYVNLFHSTKSFAFNKQF